MNLNAVQPGRDIRLAESVIDELSFVPYSTNIAFCVQKSVPSAEEFAKAMISPLRGKSVVLTVAEISKITKGFL